MPSNAVSARILWATCDAISAYLLVQIWRTRSKTSGSTREKMIFGAWVATFNLQFRVSWTTSIIQISSQSLSISIIACIIDVDVGECAVLIVDVIGMQRYGCLAFYMSSPLLTINLGRTSLCLSSLALLTHLSLPTVLFAPPLILLLLGNPESSLASPKPTRFSPTKYTALFLQFAAYLTVLGLICTLATGGTSWAWKSWGAG